ncbi:MAG: hypothetical protein LBQ59_02335 [Candidatus Peribacteria bacterium]|nr:hypothetical protein [Candidatus Peribacteria bacterium]
MLSYNLALDLQNDIALFVIHHILDKKISQTIKISAKAIIVGNISDQNSSLVLSFIEILVSISGFFSHKSVKESFFGNITISLTIFSNQFSTTTPQE